MSKTADEYIIANRDAWNEAAPFHATSQEFAELMGGFSEPRFSCLDPVETEWLTKIGVAGKSVAQLCCNNGREILSIKNMGADYCVGFDGSGRFLDHARELANIGQLDCQFVETDVHQIGFEFHQKFDVCVITIGVFGWMPDIDRFFSTVNGLLKPGGKLFIHEQHPIMNMFEPWNASPYRPACSYFRAEPFAESRIITYDGVDKGRGKTHYWFVHTLSDVISGCLKIGLTLEAFEEYAENISSAEYDVYEEQEAQLPLSYILVMAKPTCDNTNPAGVA